MSNHKKQEMARQLYLHTELSHKDIADQVGVAQKTISGKGGWIQKFNWDQLKAAQNSTRDELLKNCYTQILRIQNEAINQDRTQTVSETDQIVKLTKTIATLDKSITLSVRIQVLKEFEIYLVKIDQPLAQTLNDHSTKFLHSKIDG